ncbi:hypothetical protein EI94DRAFT_1732230 [Lactarius quietus]|nr:hypothetical protein EI94DRAFT_1732230 [Lactarius quietus]
MPMDTLPEDLPMDTKPARSPSPPRAKAAPLAPAPAPSPPPSPPPLYSPASSPRTSVSVSTSAAASTSTAPPAPSPPPAPPSPSNWLHIPKAGGIPLISAFRQSLSSVASRGSSLPTMQHYPSFNKSQNAQSAASGSTRSSQTFYSAGGDVGHGNGNGPPPSPTPPVPPLPSEHGELPRPPPPRLKPGGGGERVTQVHLTPPEGHHAASRQASMVYSQNSASAVPGSLRPGANSRPVSSTVGSGSSSLSLYVDARSQIGGASGDDGRSNGSVGGSTGSARGRVR